MQPTTCLNCGYSFTSTEKFCAECGQKSDTHRLDLHEILHDSFHALTHADKGILFLIKELAYRPGKVAKEYIDGKRKKYFNPFSFFVIITGVLVLVSSNFHIFGRAMETESANTTEVQKPQSDRIKNAKIRSAEFSNFVNNHPNVVLFVSTPFLAFFFWIFYKKRKLVYAEHLTAMAFFNSFLMLMTSVIFAPIIYFTKDTNLYPVWLVLMVTSHVIYVGFGHKQLFSLKGVGGFLKTMGYSFLAMFCWMIFSLVIGFSYIMWG